MNGQNFIDPSSMPPMGPPNPMNVDPQIIRDMTKSTKWVCAQRRLGSAWAFAQSEQSLRCPHEESLGS